MQRAFPVLLAVAAVLAACGGPASPVGPGQSPNPVTPAPVGSAATDSGDQMSAEDVAKARALIDATDLADSESIAALGEIRFTPAAQIAASQRLSEGATGDGLWAATWVYVSTGTDPVPLLPLLGNDDPTIHVLAAAGLTALGRLEGLDALVTSIGTGDFLRGSHPPVTVAQFAAFSLSRYTSEAVANGAVFTPDDRTALAAAWSAWLQANRGRLAFDADQQAWLVQ